MAEIWLPIIGSGGPDDPYRPDIPTGIAWRTYDGIPVNLDGENIGRPIAAHALVSVAEEDAEKCAARVAPADVPEPDRLIVSMLRECRGRMDLLAPEFIGRIADGANVTAERKALVKRLLIHAVHRGLSAEKAMIICETHGLPACAAERSGAAGRPAPQSEAARQAGR